MKMVRVICVRAGVYAPGLEFPDTEENQKAVKEFMDLIVAGGAAFLLVDGLRLFLGATAAKDAVICIEEFEGGDA